MRTNPGTRQSGNALRKRKCKPERDSREASQRNRSRARFARNINVPHNHLLCVRPKARQEAHTRIIACASSLTSAPNAKRVVNGRTGRFTELPIVFASSRSNAQLCEGRRDTHGQYIVMNITIKLAVRTLGLLFPARVPPPIYTRNTVALLEIHEKVS